jgi:RNA polymerase sigma-70 factor (ECF subfamily)
MAVRHPATRDDERTLLVRARRGDADAFLALVEPHDRGLRALAFRLLGDRELMDEALQNAYANAFAGIGTFGGRAAVSTWLYRIAYNACLDELRRLARMPELVPLAEQSAAASTDGDGDPDLPVRLDLAAALRTLPVELRAPVLLVDGHGFSYPEAADVLGVPEGTVASRLNRARAALRAALADEREDA